MLNDPRLKRLDMEIDHLERLLAYKVNRHREIAARKRANTDEGRAQLNRILTSYKLEIHKLTDSINLRKLERFELLEGSNKECGAL